MRVHLNKNLTKKVIASNAPFYKTIRSLEKVYKLPIHEWDEELTEEFMLERVKFLCSIAQNTRLYGTRLKDYKDLKSCDELIEMVGVIARDEMAGYMDPISGLGYPFGFLGEEGYVVANSGGSSGRPTRTYYTHSERESIASEEVRNYRALLDEFGANSYWDTLIEEKAAANDPFWQKQKDIHYFRGKATSAEEALQYLK